MNQILLVNKKSNYTSRDVVNKLNKILNEKKIGHTGTLDPLAEGVLVCLTGKYTKLADYLTSYNKEYIAKVKFGICTDTLDITGKEINKSDIIKYDIKYIKEILNSFVGEYLEEIPLYSAKHVNGKRLYEYARNNEEVILPKEVVNINDIELLDYDIDSLLFKVNVSKGTYIRSLIQDICKKLNMCGTMESLTRTKQGDFDIKDSYTLEDIENNNYKDISIYKALNVKEIVMNDDLYFKVKNGNKINDKINGYVMYTYNQNDIALYYFENNEGRLKILF